MLPIKQCDKSPRLTVVMPTAKRPEMLALALQKLETASSNLSQYQKAHSTTTTYLSNLDVRIYADTQANLEHVEYVRDQFYPDALILHAKPHSEAPSGTWNILNSIKAGYETGADLVFLIEEDVLVRPNFFEHHLSTMATGEYLASCGRKDRGHYPVYGALYTNPGSCLSRALVEQLIPHLNDEYYRDLRGYLDCALPPRWDEQSNLDDGLIRRVVRQMGGKVAYPDTGVCVHQGWAFYNKIDIYMNDETDIEKRIARLKELISKIRPGDRYARDFEAY